MDAGWYDDPTGRYKARLWDGDAWTDRVRGRSTPATDAPLTVDWSSAAGDTIVAERLTGLDEFDDDLDDDVIDDAPADNLDLAPMGVPMPADRERVWTELAQAAAERASLEPADEGEPGRQLNSRLFVGLGIVLLLAIVFLAVTLLRKEETPVQTVPSATTTSTTAPTTTTESTTTTTVPITTTQPPTTTTLRPLTTTTIKPSTTTSTPPLTTAPTAPTAPPTTTTTSKPPVAHF